MTSWPFLPTLTDHQYLEVIAMIYGLSGTVLLVLMCFAFELWLERSK